MLDQRLTARLRHVLPALAALVYPAIIWCGPAISPLFLGVAVVAPVVAVAVFHRTATTFPRSRGIALFAVGAPALYSWLGGLLDFQRALPINDLGVWFPLWTACGVVAFVERPTAHPRDVRASRLAFMHGVAATVIATFAIGHLANHLAGLWGGQYHLSLMSSLRIVYRQPFVETALLASVAFQFASGVRLVVDKAQRAGDWIDTLQSASGAYLACFFLSHLTAVIRARIVGGVDTNWIWLTAESMLTDAWSARLAPYYFLGIVALGVHAGAGLRYVMIARGHARVAANRAFAGVTMAAAAASAVIMTGLLRAV
jgi:succinate dehydrogenase/fumarate reductase cytochrome b subunit